MSRFWIGCGKAFALQYVKEPSLSLSQIAWLLGYEGSTSFHHAFRRWTGRSPSVARSEKLLRALRSKGPVRKGLSVCSERASGNHRPARLSALLTGAALTPSLSQVLALVEDLLRLVSPFAVGGGSVAPRAARRARGDGQDVAPFFSADDRTHDPICSMRRARNQSRTAIAASAVTAMTRMPTAAGSIELASGVRSIIEQLQRHAASGGR